MRRRRVLALAVPAVVTLVADPLLGLVDTAVVGRVGAAELGALGLAVALLSAVSWVFNFLVFGTTSTVAKALGAGDTHAAGRRVVHAAQVALVLGILVGVGLLLTAPWLVRASGAVDTLVDPAVTYLRIRAFGVPLLLLAYVGHGAFRGASDTRTPLRIVIVANLGNAALTPWLALTLELGIAGAAWATVAAEAVVVVWFAVLLGRGRDRLPLRGHRVPGRAELGALVRVSRDLFLRTGGLLAGLLAVTAAAARTGEATAAAHQVLHQTFLLVSFLMDGLAIAAQALVGTALGAGRAAEARAYGRDLVRLGIVGGAVLAAALLLGQGLLPRLLTDDPVVLATIASAWWLAALGHVLNGPVFALDGVLMGAEDYRYLRTWTVVAAVVGAAGAQVAVAAGAGLLGLWVAVQALMAVRLVSLVLRVRGDAWTSGGVGLVGR